jgi:hypothetical protein
MGMIHLAYTLFHALYCTSTAYVRLCVIGLTKVGGTDQIHSQTPTHLLVGFDIGGWAEAVSYLGATFATPPVSFFYLFFLVPNLLLLPLVFLSAKLSLEKKKRLRSRKRTFLPRIRS